jgi:DNA-binding HxlR family transcriptional regulator
MQEPETHPRFLFDIEACGLKRALGVLGEKWTLLLLRECFYGITRFDDFARALGCGRGVLSARLKTLTDAGILKRREYAAPGQRQRAEYKLTEMGRDLYPSLLGICQWGDKWMPAEDGPVAIITNKASGRLARVVLTDDEGVAQLGVRDMNMAPGPGAIPIKDGRAGKRRARANGRRR